MHNSSMPSRFAATILIFASLLFFALTVILKSGKNTQNSETFLAPPPEYIEQFHFGFRESMADSFWLRWIQDSDTCQVYGKQNLANVQIEDNNPLTKVPRHKVCDNSWAFKMLDTITKLAPRFKMAYMAGAPALSILVEDYTGATVIFERGLKAFPNEWPLLYRAAYHFQFDLKDLPRAAELLIRAADHGAPTWVRSLAARLYTSAGQLELGISTLESYKKTLSEEKAIQAVDKRIAELKAKLQP